MIHIMGILLPLDILDRQMEESEQTENAEKQEIIQEDEEYVEIEASTNKPQTQQEINEDVVEGSSEGGYSPSNIDHSNNKIGVDKFVDEDDFHSDGELIEDIKIG